jgi:hypothetical protein
LGLFEVFLGLSVCSVRAELRFNSTCMGWIASVVARVFSQNTFDDLVAEIHLLLHGHGGTDLGWNQVDSVSYALLKDDPLRQYIRC